MRTSSEQRRARPWAACATQRLRPLSVTRTGALATRGPGLLAALMLAALIPFVTLAQSGDAPARLESGLVCVIGASGSVGNGIVRELLAAGHRVIAVSRSEQNLAAIRDRFADSPGLETVLGDVGTEAQGAALRDEIERRFGQLDGVVTSVGSPEWNARVAMLDAPYESLDGALRDNFQTHFVAAKSLIPLLRRNGTFISISGGLSDLVRPGSGYLSITQSAQRALVRVLDEEAQADASGVHVRLLGLYSLVATERNRDRAEDDWITDTEVGRRVIEMIERPDAYPDAIQELRPEN